MKILKKILSIVLCAILLFQNTVFVSFAQEAETTPTPTPTPVETSVDNTGEINNDIDSNAVTGDNTIQTPTPTPETLLETSTLVPDATETPTPNPTPTPSEIITGDAVSEVQMENSVNTNIVNSTVIYHTLNIYLPDESGDIDLSQAVGFATNKVFAEDQNTSENVSLQMLGIDNFAYIENDVNSEAITGGNQIESTGSGEITTGNSYSVISIFNNVNTNIVDSELHLVTINIFGNLTGNIILPEYTGEAGCINCSQNLETVNTAVVNNNVDSNAISGENVVTTSGDGSIETGVAVSNVNVLNIVNTTLSGVYFGELHINTFGEWSGSFLGWMGMPGETDGNVSLALSQEGSNQSPCSDCSTNSANLENNATVNNNISSSAVTGQNKVAGENGKITTGNAYSAISLINLVNTNIINSKGFIGFINIFGKLNGDIGGVSEFKVEEEDVPITSSQSENQSPEHETGGLLEVEHTNNVGAFVYPGDTVTFTAKVKNPGTGDVYETKLYIDLIKDGNNYGTIFFDLGEISEHKSKKITTGLVLSKKTPPGVYTAVVHAHGKVGPENAEVEAYSESTFRVASLYPAIPEVAGIVEAGDTPQTPSVMGVTAEKTDMWKVALYSLPLLALLYMLARLGRRALGEIPVLPAPVIRKRRFAIMGIVLALLISLGALVAKAKNLH